MCTEIIDHYGGLDAREMRASCTQSPNARLSTTQNLRPVLSTPARPSPTPAIMMQRAACDGRIRGARLLIEPTPAQLR